MEQVSRVSNLSVKRKIKDPLSEKPEKKKRVSPVYKTPFVCVYNNIHIHSDTFMNMESVFFDIVDGQHRVVITFKDHRDVYIYINESSKITHPSKKGEQGEEVVDLMEKIGIVIEHVKDKYKNQFKQKAREIEQRKPEQREIEQREMEQREMEQRDEQREIEQREVEQREKKDNIGVKSVVGEGDDTDSDSDSFNM